MKKTLILFILILICSTGISQKFYKVITASYLEYKDGKFQTKQESQPDNMFVIVGEKKVRITNKDKDVYQIFGEEIQTKKEDHSLLSYKAYDKEGNKCDITMTIYKGESVLYVNIFYITSGYGLQYKVDFSNP